MDWLSPQRGYRPTACWCGKVFPALAITAPLSGPSVSSGCISAMQVEVGMSLECWQTKGLLRLAENCLCFMRKIKCNNIKMKHCESAVLSICICPALTGWRSGGSFSYRTQVLRWTMYSIMNYCLFALMCFAVSPGDGLLDGKSHIRWSWPITEAGTFGYAHGESQQLSQVQFQVWNTSKWRIKYSFPEHFILWKALWYFNILSQVITETNTEILEIPVGWNSMKFVFALSESKYKNALWVIFLFLLS